MTRFGPKNAPFPRRNANLTNGTYFTRPTPPILYVGPLSCIFEGQRGPKHKDFAGPGLPWSGGVWEGVAREILYVYAF